MSKIATLSRTREIMEEYGISARKKYGQNFLIDHNIVDLIAERVPERKRVIEIGPGLGALTEEILPEKAYEIDSDLVSMLEKEFEGRTVIINKDFLEADDYQGAEVLVSNVPYYITTDILTKIFHDPGKLEKIIIMVQKEVAEKLLGNSDKKDRGPLNVLIDYYCDVRKVCTVNRSCFYPRPNVDSEVVELVFKNKEELSPEFVKMVETCFRQKRKLVLSNLKNEGYTVNEEIKAQFAGKRAEELSVEDFLTIYEAVK